MERTFPGNSSLVGAEELSLGDSVQVGPDVVIRARRVSIGAGVRLGTLDAPDAFRHPGGIRIEVDELVLGDGVRIDRSVLVRGGRITLGQSVHVESGVTVNVTRQLTIGANSAIREQAQIAGVDIVVGRHFRMLPQAVIGGGSAMEVQSSLRIGHFGHVGTRAFLNTARPIVLGDEVGLGTGTCLYTHGAYPSVLEGKPAAYGPITVGDRTWIPGAVVNPGVTLGRDCVVGVGSVVTRSLPDGCLAAGAPARVIRENAYPKPLDAAGMQRFFAEFLQTLGTLLLRQEGGHAAVDDAGVSLPLGATFVRYQPDGGAAVRLPPGVEHLILLSDRAPSAWAAAAAARRTGIGLFDRVIVGAASPASDKVVDQLRRYGVRFGYEARDGEYQRWA